MISGIPRRAGVLLTTVLLFGCAPAATLDTPAPQQVNLAATAERAPNGYRLPPAPIPQILDAAPTPLVSVSPDRAALAFYGREGMPAIAQLEHLGNRLTSPFEGRPE